jgi:thymidine phosphorylase
VFRLTRIAIDTHSEHVIFLHRDAVTRGALGLQPLDRVRVIGRDPESGKTHEIQGVVNFCHDGLIAEDEIGLCESAFADLGLPIGNPAEARLAAPPESIVQVRNKLAGGRLTRTEFDSILQDVAQRRYSKIELSMFVLACALRRLDIEELADFTRAMIACGNCLDFGEGPIADKHCIGGIPGNRTTMILVPIVASLGVKIPKTSSRAITSPAGTADTMGVLADVALGRERMYDVVDRVGGCIAWGGALDLAPADDVLITVERPMGIDTEAQMIASIMSKKLAAGSTFAIIDIPTGRTAKVRSRGDANALGARFEAIADAVGLDLDVVVTDSNGPIGRGIGPRLEALDVLAVLNREADAPVDLREKSLFLAARILESVGAVEPSQGYVAAREALDSGRAARKFDEIIELQGRREIPAEAPLRGEVLSPRDGQLRSLDCQQINALAKLAGAPAHPAAGLRVLRKPGDVVVKDEPLIEIHARSDAHLRFAEDHARAHSDLFEFGY